MALKDVINWHLGSLMLYFWSSWKNGNWFAYEWYLLVFCVSCLYASYVLGCATFYIRCLLIHSICLPMKMGAYQGLIGCYVG